MSYISISTATKNCPKKAVKISTAYLKFHKKLNNLYCVHTNNFTQIFAKNPKLLTQQLNFEKQLCMLNFNTYNEKTQQYILDAVFNYFEEN